MEERDLSRPLALVRHGLAAALTGLLAMGAGAEPRAVMQPLPGLEIGYKHLAPQLETPAPGQFEGSVATPAGTLRTSVRVAPDGEYVMQPGDTSFDMPAPGVVPGQVQLRALQDGGTAAAWRAPLGYGTAAETRTEWKPDRTGQALRLRHDLGWGNAAQAQVSKSSTAWADGSRLDLELTQRAGPLRLMLGADAADRGYISPSGGAEPRAGLRLGTQWPLAEGVRMEARYTRKSQWDADDPASALMLGTQLALPGRARLATGVEVDTQANRKAQMTLTVPLEAP